jgi:hypothetical protein
MVGDIVSTNMFGNYEAVSVLSLSAKSTTANVSDCVIAEGTYGVKAYTGNSSAFARIFVTRSTIHNMGFALASSTAGSGTATVTVSNTMVVNNFYAWFQDGAGSTIRTFQNNPMSDNNTVWGVLTNTPPV